MVIKSLLCVVSNLSRPFGGLETGCWQCINVAFCLVEFLCLGLCDDDEVVPASCQQSTLPKTEPNCMPIKASSQLSDPQLQPQPFSCTPKNPTEPNRKKKQNSVTNALMTAGCDGQKRSSPYHRIIFDTSDSCQRFANSLCRFRPQMRHENVENNLLNATNSICQCGSDASIKTGQCRQSFKHK